MTIAIIILVHNVNEAGDNLLDMTYRCVSSIYETATQPFELYLVDNGSRDFPKTYEFLFNLAGVGNVLKQKATVVRNEENTAISKCWNTAIGSTTGDYIFLINNDTSMYQKGWMELVLHKLNVSNVGVTGLQAMSWNDFSFVEGSFFCFTRATANRLGGSDGKVFDEQFLFSCEDADACRRIQYMGLQTIQEQSLGRYIKHDHHGTLSYVDREGGWPGGQPIQSVTHDMRRLLCRKWGIPERIND